MINDLPTYHLGVFMAMPRIVPALTMCTLLSATAFAASTATPASATTGVTSSITTTSTSTTKTVGEPASASTLNTKAAEAMLNKLTRNQVEIVQTFPSVGNLQGFVVKGKGDQSAPSIVYVDEQGRYAIVGSLLTANGVNQSDADTQKYINATVAKTALVDSPNTAWIQDGNPNAKHSTYIIADPNCIYCHKLYEMTRPAVKSGDLSIRWIWVGFLKDSSAGIAKAILAAKDPIAAMAQNENQFNDSNESGGLAPLANPTPDTNDKFAKNMAFLNKYQFPGTPVLIYQDTQGNPMSLYGVSPDDLDKTIKTMGQFPS